MNCGFKTTANTEDEMLAKIAEHAKTVHHMDKIDDETMAKVREAIKDE
jgi:predicted small metal-binding protein